MRLVPKTISAQMEFWGMYLQTWAGHEAEIGLSLAEISALQAALDDAENGRVQQQVAMRASQSATVVFNQKISKLNRMGSAALARIKANAAEDPQVWTAARVPMPEKPSPAGIPSRPTNLRHHMDGNGFIVLQWDGSTQHHTFFKVSRMLDGESGWTMIGSVATKSFRDENIPPGAKSAIYRVTASRAAGDSVSTRLPITYGPTRLAA